MKNTDFIKKYALSYLSKYDTSKKNLLRILVNKVKRMKIEKREKNNLIIEINNLLFNLESKNLINDKNYSENKFSNFCNQGKSKRYIVNYLILKGVELNLINEIIKDLNINQPLWEINSARIFVRKKGLGKSKENEILQKDLGKMARAGFNYDLCKKTLLNG